MTIKHGNERKRRNSNLATRRNMLKIGAGLSVAALAGCSLASTRRQSQYDRPYSRQAFAAPRVSSDRVIRAITGSRPYRPSGFVVKAEQFDAKTVVHNYGHGGGGISISWGSSALAVRELAGMEAREAAVIGSGFMGLTTARLLQERGWRVTIYTREPARHSTSNVGAGHWAPGSMFDEAVATPEFKSRYAWAARVAHHAYTNLGGTKYGVRWLENYELGHAPISIPYYKRALPELFPSLAVLSPDEHPFPVPYVTRYVTMLIDPGTMLRQLFADFLQAGGQYTLRDFAAREQVLALNESVIFNCTGLGAKALFGDDELVPVKGQLVFLPPDPAIDYMTIGGGQPGGGLLYMFPRTDALVLGGTFKRGDWSRNVESGETARIVAGHRELFENFAR